MRARVAKKVPPSGHFFGLRVAGRGRVNASGRFSCLSPAFPSVRSDAGRAGRRKLRSSENGWTLLTSAKTELDACPRVHGRREIGSEG